MVTNKDNRIIREIQKMLLDVASHALLSHDFSLLINVIQRIASTISLHRDNTMVSKEGVKIAIGKSFIQANEMRTIIRI